METILTRQQIIVDLHKRGYHDDFEMRCNDLLWIQAQRVVYRGDYSIIECHWIRTIKPIQSAILVFGVFVHSYNTKGILIKHVSTPFK